MDWKMPDLGEGVQEAEIIKWLVKEGETVVMDQHLVEVMTDKASMEIPSSVEGKVQKILVKEGKMAKIGEVLAEIGEEDTRERKTESGKQRTENGERKTESRESMGRVLASPAIRQLARESNVDLNQIHGTGPGGRITKEDVEQVSSVKDQVPALPAGRSSPGEERKPLRGLRRKIAEHMVLSRKSAAHFTHFDEADFTELVALRESEKPKAEAKGIKLTYLPYIIKAVIAGLKKYPQLNASLDEAKQEVVYKNYYHIGVAVATDEGLIVPVVKNADRLSLFDLAKEISRLGEAARDKRIALDDLKGGTFTLTNIGSIGGILSAPIINYPEVAIMGLHQIKPRPVVKDGKIVARQMMYISVSADHRVVDGAEVAAFSKEVIDHLEKPLSLTLSHPSTSLRAGKGRGNL